MSRLTREEREELERIVELEEIREKRRKEEKFKRITGGIAILMIMSIFPYVWFFQYIDFCLHKNQVQVENVRMVDRGWDEADGEHFVQFYVDIKTGREEVILVTFHTLVYKDGKFIGYLDSDIPGPILKEEDGSRGHVFDTNTETTLYFNLSGGHQISKADDIFRELYGGNPEDYTFVVKFMGAQFSDGTTVGHVHLDFMDFQYDENGEIHFNDNYLLMQGYWWK